MKNRILKWMFFGLSMASFIIAFIDFIHLFINKTFNVFGDFVVILVLIICLLFTFYFGILYQKGTKQEKYTFFVVLLLLSIRSVIEPLYMIKTFALYDGRIFSGFTTLKLALFETPHIYLTELIMLPLSILLLILTISSLNTYKFRNFTYVIASISAMLVITMFVLMGTSSFANGYFIYIPAIANIFLIKQPKTASE